MKIRIQRSEEELRERRYQRMQMKGMFYSVFVPNSNPSFPHLLTIYLFIYLPTPISVCVINFLHTSLPAYRSIYLLTCKIPSQNLLPFVFKFRLSQSNLTPFPTHLFLLFCVYLSPSLIPPQKMGYVWMISSTIVYAFLLFFFFVLKK